MQKYGFTLVEEKNTPEVGGVCRLWKYEKNGAQVLSIVNRDENKCFGASFYTPPVNSTGVAHILEHSVLCGSDRFPVKEPFVELLKGSLQTFLNAFTFPDKTCYPVASANLRDFYNLIDVYLDAVFHPLLTRDIFSQEGWHVEAENADGPWTFKGVVYNEMKGVYSSPDSVLAEQSQQAVFPDNLYCLDSGGNPEHIPDLTYEAFCEFHRRYYQPGNARFFFWGDDPEAERLQIIAKAIAGYGPVADLPPLPLQKKFSAPRQVEIPFAAAEGEKRALFTLNWLQAERGDVLQALKMEMLEHILEGLPGSPLRRALMESGYGEDTVGCGLETDLRQMYYSTGLKGVEPANVGKAEQLILDTLRELAEKGIDPEAVAAAVNSIEFAYRENNSGRFPRGLAAMIQSLSTWLYGGNPIEALAWEEPLAQIKKALANGEKVFENAIRECFLENTHRVRVTLSPDEKLGALRSETEKARVAEIQEQSSPAARVEMAAETARLQATQLAPDKPEDLAKIPALVPEDLPRKNAIIPREIKQIPETFIFNDLPTSGVAYVTLLLPINALPERLLPLMPLFSRSLLEWGTADMDYTRLGTEIAAQLGGLGAAPLLGVKTGGRDAFCYLSIGAKAVYDNVDSMFALMREILLKPQKDSSIIMQRTMQMILEEKARLEYSLQMGGHLAVAARIRAHFRGMGALAEKMNGISQLEHIRTLADRMEKEPENVLSDFEELRQHVLGAKNAVFACVAEEKIAATLENCAKNLLSSLPADPVLRNGERLAAWSPMSSLPKGEAFITPGQVNFVGKGANLYDAGYKFSGSANVIIRWLRMGRLWEKVRVAGGAYGVSCSLDQMSGTFICTSYRDPNVDATLSAYDGLAAYLREFTPARAQLNQAIVGAVGDLDAYLLPDAKGAKSVARWLAGRTDEERQQDRDEMFATTAADFHAFADVLAAFAQEGVTSVLGGDKTELAAKEHGWKTSKLL